eukprot:SAG22_NODE_2566_length_2434_cov_1.406852_4_plen_115_part_00
MGAEDTQLQHAQLSEPAMHPPLSHRMRGSVHQFVAPDLSVSITLSLSLSLTLCLCLCLSRSLARSWQRRRHSVGRLHVLRGRGIDRAVEHQQTKVCDTACCTAAVRAVQNFDQK